MTHHWDEFSKSLAEKSVPRRESLRRMGAVFAGAVLGQLGLGTVWAGGRDPCKEFCRCRNKTEQNACLAACRNCNNNPTRLCGSCGGGYACTDLANDVHNCGSCGNSCQPGQYETAACVSGQCEYSCVAGTVNCDGTCADLANDFDNCGSCGFRCPTPGPYEFGACSGGVCLYACVDGAVQCNGACSDLATDPNNCGGCGQVCAAGEVCSGGACCNPTISDCYGGCVGSCPEGWCGGNGCGGVCACPDGWYCESNGWCYPGCSPDNPYYPNC